MFDKIQLMLELRKIMSRLQANHPKFPAFINAVRQNGVGAGSIIEIKVTDPYGKEFITNVKLNEEDMDCIRQLNELQKKMR